MKTIARHFACYSENLGQADFDRIESKVEAEISREASFLGVGIGPIRFSPEWESAKNGLSRRIGGRFTAHAAAYPVTP